MDTRIRVLHVDDDPAFGELTATFLERADSNLTVDTVESAADGLDRLETTQFDCLLSDYDMPETTGLDFLQSVRETHPEFPFILLTGNGSETVASEAIAAGVTDYLQKKPGTDHYSLLANRIVNAVSRHRAEQTEQWLCELGENTDDVLWMFSGDWSELLFVNSAYEELWGQPVDRLERHPHRFLSGVHPADRGRVRVAMLELSDGRPVDLEYRVDPTDEYSRWVWMKGHPILEDDAVVRITGFARDITERKRRERERDATVEFLHSLYDVTADSQLTFEEKIHALLSLGCDQLDSSCGFVTAIEYDEQQPAHGSQTIVEAYGTHDQVRPGDSCPLSEAYCRKTIERDELLTVNDVVSSEFEETAAYERFRFQSYIGGKVYVDDEVYGTLCFASGSPRESPFTDAERTLVRLVSKWVSYELECGAPPPQRPSQTGDAQSTGN